SISILLLWEQLRRFLLSFCYLSVDLYHSPICFQNSLSNLQVQHFSMFFYSIDCIFRSKGIAYRFQSRNVAAAVSNIGRLFGGYIHQLTKLEDALPFIILCKNDIYGHFRFMGPKLGIMPANIGFNLRKYFVNNLFLWMNQTRVHFFGKLQHCTGMMRYYF